MAVCGCQVQEMDEITTETKNDREAKVFTAIIEDNSLETKTSLDNDGNVLWQQGDQVSIFAGSTINEQYQVTDASDGKTSATLDKVSGPGFVAGTDIDNNVAFYPYAAAAGIAKSGSSYVISGISLPATQNYVQASFGDNAFPMVAVTTSTTDMNLKFKNVLGGLKLQLKGTATIASISVTGNGDEILCGDARVTVYNGTLPSVVLTDVSAKTVTLDCGNGVQLNATTAIPFIIALPAMTMEGGFTVVVTDTEGKQMEIKTTKSQTITRSNLLKMPAVTYEGTSVFVPQAVDLGLPSGLRWATCNVGATTPEEYGDYFAWGETEPQYSSLDPLTWKDGKSSGYTWVNYKFRTIGEDIMDARGLSKYNTNSNLGTIDNKTTLEMADDAASANWGDGWRMPTDEEWTELRTKCTWTWTSQNGVDGYLVTGTNGNSIFLPAAGQYLDGIYANSDPSLYGYYWSSYLYLDGDLSVYACYVYFDSASVRGSGCERYFGQSVRPVTE